MRQQLFSYMLSLHEIVCMLHECYMQQARGYMYAATCMLEACCINLVHACCMHVLCNMHAFGTICYMHAACRWCWMHIRPTCIHAWNKHVGYMLATCIPHAHYMHPASTLTCRLHAAYMQLTCTLHATRMHTTCRLHASRMHTTCINNRWQRAFY